jgi:hypothetical protein
MVKLSDYINGLYTDYETKCYVGEIEVRNENVTHTGDFATSKNKNKLYKTRLDNGTYYKLVHGADRKYIQLNEIDDVGEELTFDTTELTERDIVLRETDGLIDLQEVAGVDDNLYIAEIVDYDGETFDRAFVDTPVRSVVRESDLQDGLLYEIGVRHGSLEDGKQYYEWDEDSFVTVSEPSERFDYNTVEDDRDEETEDIGEDPIDVWDEEYAPLFDDKELEQEIREKVSATFNGNTLRKLVRDLYWFGPMKEGVGGKMRMDIDDDFRKGTGLRRPKGALYQTPESHRKSILRKALEIGLIEKHGNEYVATEKGNTVRETLDICDDCGDVRQSCIHHFVVFDLNGNEKLHNRNQISLCTCEAAEMKRTSSSNHEHDFEF